MPEVNLDDIKMFQALRCASGLHEPFIATLDVNRGDKAVTFEVGTKDHAGYRFFFNLCKNCKSLYRTLT